MKKNKGIDLDALDEMDEELQDDQEEPSTPKRERRSVYEKFTKKKTGPKKKLKDAKAQTYIIEQSDIDALTEEAEKQNISQSEYMRQALKLKLKTDRKR
ncbi:ribbon-helix-helix protein, CopG family [Alkalicoccus luteus]|uniref:Ribbon-helix-helix protein, CopG family n=1 Tax=Alkalicoccus luteus TaxID=1237094 RepID=A0A969PRC0_9BACI|nr:ribbon-helix-helix protein, CopG family [Alkalicoccus luteus]NJP38967.1 ribbon-helix-helix protein, CopG family [Alkalicoccus luteus]